MSMRKEPDDRSKAPTTEESDLLLAVGREVQEQRRPGLSPLTEDFAASINGSINDTFDLECPSDCVDDAHDTVPATVFAHEPLSSSEGKQQSTTSSVTTTTHFHGSELFATSLGPAVCNLREDQGEEINQDISAIDSEVKPNKQEQSASKEDLVAGIEIERDNHPREPPPPAAGLSPQKDMTGAGMVTAGETLHSAGTRNFTGLWEWALEGLAEIPQTQRPVRSSGRLQHSLPGAHHVRGIIPSAFHASTPRQTEGILEESSSPGNSTNVEPQGLIVATPVFELEMAEPEDDNNDYEFKEGGSRWKQGGYISYSRVLMLIVFAVVVARAAVLLRRKGGVCCGDPATKIREAHIRTLILDAFGNDYLDNQPKKKALHWIIFEDPKNTGLASTTSTDLATRGPTTDDDNNNLVQRYSLVAFYFQSSYENPWQFCNPPEADETSLCYYVEKSQRTNNKETNIASARWLSAAHECQWMDITCTGGAKLITDIRLYGRNLTGSLPSELSKLSSLTSITVPQNHLSGPLPFWISQLPRLQRIELSSNQFTGTLPSGYFSLTKLTSLTLRSNLLTGPIPVKASAQDLEHMDLSSNMLTGTIPLDMYSLPNLRYANLQDNKLTGSIYSCLGNLSELVWIYLGNNQLIGSIPSEVGNLKMLELLDIEGNGIEGSIPDAVWTMEQLKQLRLGHSRISGSISSNIGHLTKLYEFQIADTRISGTIPTSISNLSRLRTFYVEWNPNLVGSIPEKFCSNLHQVHEICTHKSCPCCLSRWLLHNLLRFYHENLQGTIDIGCK